MTQAVFDDTQGQDKSRGRRPVSCASGSVQKFDGFLKVYEEIKVETGEETGEKEDEKDNSLPEINQGEALALKELITCPAFYAAAAGIYRRDAGKDAGRKGHWQAVHVRAHHFHACGRAVHRQGTGTSLSRASSGFWVGRAPEKFSGPLSTRNLPPKWKTTLTQLKREKWSGTRS